MTSTTAVYNMIQDLRILARRDSSEHRPTVDRDLEQFRLSFLDAFEAFMDLGKGDLQPFIVVGNKIISSNKELLKWLKHELELEADW
jgi:hypothetical protein